MKLTCENSTLGFRFALCRWFVLFVVFFSDIWSHLFIVGLSFDCDSKKYTNKTRIINLKFKKSEIILLIVIYLCNILYLSSYKHVWNK